MAENILRFSLFQVLIFFSIGVYSFENPVFGVSQLGNSESGISDRELITQRIILFNQNAVLDRLNEYSSHGHRVLGYLRARQLLLGRVYLEEDHGQYSIRDVYCLKNFTNNDFGRDKGLGPDQIPSSDILNTEHTWPQSRFTSLYPEEMQKSDLHHLFPSDSEMNSKRGNLKFAELAGRTIPVKCTTSKLANTPIGYRFEPPAEHRGNVARALFYFSVRYKIPIDNDEEIYLRKWHQEDPVDQSETKHHEYIIQLQGNRNPFVDRPQLVNQIVDFN